MSDVEYLLQFLDISPHIWELLDIVDKKLLKDENFIVDIIEHLDYFFDEEEIMEALDKKWFDNEKVMLALIKARDGDVLKYVSERLKNDEEFLIKAIEINEYEFENLPQSLKTNKKFILKALEKNGCVLQFVDENLQDKKMVLVAVKNNGCALKHAKDNFKSDKELVLIAIETCSYALNYVSDELKQNKEVLMKHLKIHNSLPKGFKVNKLFFRE